MPATPNIGSSGGGSGARGLQGGEAVTGEILSGHVFEYAVFDIKPARNIADIQLHATKNRLDGGGVSGGHICLPPNLERSLVTPRGIGWSSAEGGCDTDSCTCSI